MSFRDRLRDEIEYKGLKFKEVAEKAGISINTLEGYIGVKEKIPNAAIAAKLAKVLGVSVDYLVSDYEDEHDYHNPFKYNFKEDNGRMHQKKLDIIAKIKSEDIEIGKEARKLCNAYFNDMFLEYNTYEELLKILGLRSKILSELRKKVYALPDEKKHHFNLEPQSYMYNDAAAERFVKDGNAFIEENKFIEKEIKAYEINTKKLLNLSMEQRKMICTMINALSAENDK